ncbi:MAG TPA: SUF system Fe-S cluster assembly regulator [Stellaceae bacterium]|nr:SUF system Fe-S cluster assembly regulator [Stellaceae bacterium]
MIILSRLADYAVIVATHLAETAPAQANAVHVAEDTRLPPATVAKVLKQLARAGIVTAVRGAAGGYRLARPASEVSIAAVVAAIDGAPAMTQCSGSHLIACDRTHFCPTRPHWQRINQVVEQALESVTLDEMAVQRQAPFPAFAAIVQEAAAP